MNAEAGLSTWQRVLKELRNYALISAYLYVCFGILLLYKAAVLQSENVSYLPYGVALVQALVLGKFILIGDALSVGKRAEDAPLLHRIVWKSVAMLLVLVVFKILEEVIVGWFHKKTVAEVATEFMERSWLQDLAPIAMMLLVLIPLTVASELYRALGREQFRQAPMRK